MEEKSLQIRPRKRKQYYFTSKSSNPFMGTFTRSKSHIHLHRNRSGRSWTDTPSIKSIHHPHLRLNSPLRKRRRVQSSNLESGASLRLSIKDLRARARRVFSPTGDVAEEKIGDCGVGFDFGEEKCKGSSIMLEKCENFEVGLEGLDSDFGSGSGFSGADKVEGENGESVDPSSKDLEIEIRNHSPSDKKENEVIPILEEKNRVDKVESGNDCSENKKNGSISSSRLVLNSCSRRKLFKTPSSFSYRRMLPFLIDMAKNDSSTSRIDIEEFSCKVQKSSNVDSNISSVLLDSGNAENELFRVQSDYTTSLDEGDIENIQNQLCVKRQDSHGPSKKLHQTEEIGCSSEDGKNHENGITGSDELVEDCVLTTPPDATILSEIDIHDTEKKGNVNTFKTENPVLGSLSNESTCTNHMFVPKSHPSPTRRTNTKSTTKLNLNPCSQSKIFKTSSFFSYRRLLPFLMDVAKDKDALLNKNEKEKFQEKQEAKDHEQNFPNTVKVHSVDGSYDDIRPNVSTPFFFSSSSSENYMSASCKNINQPDMPNCLQLERTLPHTHVKLNEPREPAVVLPIADSGVSNGEANCSTKTSCSTIKNGSLPRESPPHVSQHSPVVIEKNPMSRGLDCHEDKAENSLKEGAFRFQGIDNSIKGILKRNPRGCRGLCNCLNCASFRLHAERAFEFSRNQMLDAEEVALGLIEELAEIRNMLEKSTGDGSNLGTIQLNQIQIREACKKALNTEQQAKQRLLQMNDDMNVHCKIKPLQRPTVTFSRYIDEKSIPITGLSTSLNQLSKEDKTNDAVSSIVLADKSNDVVSSNVL